MPSRITYCVWPSFRGLQGSAWAVAPRAVEMEAWGQARTRNRFQMPHRRTRRCCSRIRIRIRIWMREKTHLLESVWRQAEVSRHRSHHHVGGANAVVGPQLDVALDGSDQQGGQRLDLGRRRAGVDALLHALAQLHYDCVLHPTQHIATREVEKVRGAGRHVGTRQRVRAGNSGRDGRRVGDGQRASG